MSASGRRKKATRWEEALQTQSEQADIWEKQRKLAAEIEEQRRKEGAALTIQFRFRQQTRAKARVVEKFGADVDEEQKQEADEKEGTQAAKAEKLTKQQKNQRRKERQLAAKKEKEAKEEQENCMLEEAARTAEAERLMIAEDVVAELEAQGSSASHAWHRTFVCPQCDDEIENDFAFTCASALVFGWCQECTHVTVDLGAAQQRDDEV